MTENSVPIMLAPDQVQDYRDAIVRAGGTLTDQPDARALVWSRHGAPEELRELLRTLPALEWVQLPSAGVDNFVRAGVIDASRAFTSAKGAYAEPVAEHALALVLALLRTLHTRARATSWGAPAATSLFRARVTVLGGGGIAEALANLLVPFDVSLTVCRRRADAVGFADRTIGVERLGEALPDTDVLVIAAPLSGETRGLVSRDLLERLPDSAVLVNVGRGEIVVTDDLVDALSTGAIAGAALDVTDPEPLPDGHPLWSEPRALITPHSADTEAMIVPLLAERIAANVQRFAAGRPLLGTVDPEMGY